MFDLSTERAWAELQRRRAGVLGGKSGRYGLHSLRAGAATDAKAAGRPVSEIMFLGRWQSAVLLQYMCAGEQLAAEFGLPGGGMRGLLVL